MRALRALGLTLVFGLSAGCHESADQRFSRAVAPVLEARCADAACHGVSPGSAGPSQEGWFFLPTDARGKLSDLPRALAAAKAKVNSTEGHELSTLLRKTLPTSIGGQYHFQSAGFRSRDDAEYRALAEWAALVQDGGEGKEPELNARERHFQERVYPELITRGCATSTCHGSLMFGGAPFEAPPVPGTMKVSKVALRATYHEALRNLTLWGDPMRSRLLAKMLPLEQGGVPHKGGNDLFFAAELDGRRDPRASPLVQAIVEWAALERAAALGVAAAPPSSPPIVFVQGPLSPAGPFEVPPFVPGTDLYRLDAPYAGPPRNLTAQAHAQPADVRDPAISHDGQWVAFSMRKDAQDAHNIYVMRLDGSALTQLTFDASAGPGGLLVGNFSPVFGPNGGLVPQDGPPPDERIYFSSTRMAERSDLAHTQNFDLYAIDKDGRHLERLTHTLVAEVTPSFVTSGEFSGTMVYTIRRAAEAGYKASLFRFPVDHNRDFHIQPEAHPHFGSSVPARVPYGLKELPDGRGVLTLLDAHNVWRGGQLAVLERQFAVELPDGDEAKATLPNFRHALAVLTPDARREGHSVGGLWRDPFPLPDGSVLVAHASGPVDLDDPKAAARTRLLRVVLQENRATQRPLILIKEVRELYAHPSQAVSQPVAVFERPPEDPPHPRRWNEQDATGLLVHSGVQVIEALLSGLPPRSARVLREDLAVVRAVAPLSVARALAVEKVPAHETRHGQLEATNLSLTGRMPLFAAVEVPPAPDGSLAAHIPARVPVRVVTLDAQGLSTGALQPHWYAVQPGERFPVGIPPASYGARCAGCHGAMDGKVGSVLSPPTDFITQASVTAAMFHDSDRRRPKELPTVDGSFFRFADFRADVAPILRAKCAACHQGASAPKGLTLTDAPTAHYTDAYESLLAPGAGSLNGFRYVDAHGARARGSALAERLLGKELEAPAALTGTCPPPGSPPLSDDELRTVLRWVELGATFVGAPTP